MGKKLIRQTDEFYIGWQNRAPADYKKFVHIILFAFFVLAYLIASFFVSNQTGFSTGVFERNRYTSLSGELMETPFAGLRMQYGKDIYGNPVVKTIPLMNAGKFGADTIIRRLLQENPEPESNWYRVTGKLIYNRGVVLLELAADSPIVKLEEKKNFSPIQFGREDSVTLHGEIIDPKCDYGVMKPGEGKPHRDCAVRCISGGIMPVLLIKNHLKEETPVLLRGENLESINRKILPFVGMPVSVKGILIRADDWFVLKTNPDSSIRYFSSPE